MKTEGSAFIFGRFTLDTRRRSLTADGQPVPLHARAFDILTCLVIRAGTPVSRDELLREVWRGVAVSENNLSVQMSALRRVLADHGAAEAIATLPNRGYCFVEGVTPVIPAEAPAPPRRSGQTPWRVAAVLAIVCLVAAIGAARWWPGPGSRRADIEFSAIDPLPHSIAVLPFVNLSGNPAEDYVADGIADALIETLSRIGELQVTAETSSFFFKNRQVPADDIGRRLGVRMVLEGSVRQDSQHWHIFTRLIDTRTNLQVWARSFDRSRGDVLNL